MTSELNEQRWSVITERGVEAKHLTYDDARKLQLALVSATTHATIVTDEASLWESEARHQNWLKSQTTRTQ